MPPSVGTTTTASLDPSGEMLLEALETAKKVYALVKEFTKGDAPKEPAAPAPPLVDAAPEHTPEPHAPTSGDPQ